MPLFQALINGLLIGGVYALFSAGFSLIFGVQGVINIAHGELLMIGAFITYWLFEIVGLDPFLSLPFSLAGLFVLGYLMQRLVIHRVSGEAEIMSYIMTFGLHLILTNLALLAWTADPRSITTAYSGANLKLAGLVIPTVKLITCLISLGLISGLYWWLARTDTGRAIRATAQDREMACLLGVRVESIYALTFGLGAGLTGLAGSLIASFRHVEPAMGLPYTVIAFCVVVLGGMGYLPGALLGGLILGVVGSMATFFLTAGWASAITFFILYLVLLLRPTGITGRGAVQ